MTYPSLILKKNEERRLLAGHLWIYSNEIDMRATPLKSFQMGDLVLVKTASEKNLGIAYINPHVLLCVRLLSRNPSEIIDANFFKNKIQQALQLRRYFSSPFYRLIFGEADGLPGLVVDRFEDYLSVQINTAGMERLQTFMIEAFISVLKPKGILLRNDSPIRALEKLPQEIKLIYGEVPEIILLKENEATFQTSLFEGQKTGWFYDHRANRLRLKDYVSGKRVLDLFSYMGGWGIQAAVFGASEVTCVDSSAKAITFAKENAKLNSVSNKITFVRNDAFDYLKNTIAQNKKFDVIIVDPPAFIKSAKDKKCGEKAYGQINQLAMQLLNSDGVLFSSSCSMHLSADDLLNIIRQAALKSGNELVVIEQLHQAQDHPIHLSIRET